MTRNAKPDIYEQITEGIISAIESGTEKYQMPWARLGGAPKNACTNREYRGINTLILWAAAAEHGYAAPLWATYKQWSDAGAQVRRGEKSTPVVFWKFYDGSEKESDCDGADDSKDRVRCFARAYHVFNASQVDGYQAPSQPKLDQHARIESAEQFFASLPGEVIFGGDAACYSPKTDTIRMPTFEQFHSAEAYVSVYAHERIHWTGAEQRLNRDLSTRFGSDKYAMEELIAELGSSFICSHLGIASEPRRDHAPYIAHWLTVLRNEKRAIFTAASKAQQAAEYLQQLAGIAADRTEGAA